MSRFKEMAEAMRPYLVSRRRWLHQHPELSFQEHQTAAYLEEELRALGLKPQRLAETGLRAVVGGNKPGPAVALRADIDALPIHEETGLPFASKFPGKMHACGHDVHAAILLGTARALAETADPWPGPIVLIWQPAEETPPGGASLMIAEGVLDDPPVGAIFGLHIAPDVPTGQMRLRPGPFMAAADEIEIWIRGRGGHAAAPHLCVDPVPVAAQVVLALQQIVSREMDPFAPAVVGIGVIQGGAAHNVVPDEVRLVGTVRSMADSDRARIRRRIEEIVERVPAAFGAEGKLAYREGYPVLVNDAEMAALGLEAAAAVLGEANVDEAAQQMTGEDFAYYLQRTPGAFAQLGCARPGEAQHSLHSSRLVVDEDCMPAGVAYLLEAARLWFARRGKGGPG